MKLSVIATAVMCFLGLSLGLMAQGVTIKPYAGFFKPRFADVNAKLSNDITGFRNQLGEALDDPGDFGGNLVWGGRLQYQVGEGSFFGVNVTYYNETVELDHRGGIEQTNTFLFEREVELYDVLFTVHRYFDYSSWRRFNKYIGLGVGMAIANARSLSKSDYTQSSGETPLPLIPFDTVGESSGSNIAAVFSGGFDYRLTNSLSFWSEAGYQYGNIGNLEGSLTFIDGSTNTDYVTQSSFDFSGFYIRGGLGIGFAFLN